MKPYPHQINKALELEIKKYFVKQYRIYAQNQNIQLSNNILKAMNNFTLGNFKDLIGLKEVERINTYQYNESIGSKKIKVNGTRTLVIDKLMLQFLKEELLDLNKFSNDNIDEEIINYMNSCWINLDQLVRLFRNPAAHENIINSNQAEITINWLLFNKKILISLLEKMKMNN